jgi:hypothetical protein
MSGYRGSCPSCGAPIVFQLGASLLRVCEHCGVAVARKGADLAAYGRVAALIPTPSVLRLGIEGGYTDAPRFTLVGRLQLDYGAGTWDEWLMAFDNDSWAWLAESQGKFHYMAAAALPPLPRFSQVRAGQTVDLGPSGTFVATEVRKARFMTASGELPFDVEPGALLHFADLSGPDGLFATIDYGIGEDAEALYVGREVTLEELGVRDIVSEEDRQVRAQGQNLSCPQCGGPIDVRVPDQTQRVACPYCGSMLDATNKLAVLDAASAVALTPTIPLGTKGSLNGVAWTAIGAMERSVTVEGIRYAWREYLLYEPRRGFRWLVESKGHWSFVESIHAGDVKGGQAAPYFRGARFQHFQGGFATVDSVIGEFYWAVARGTQNATSDYIAPPLMLSREDEGQAGETEVLWSLGTYKEPSEIAAAFALEESALPRRQGVGPHQPSPWSGRVGRAWMQAMLAAVVMFGIFMVLLFASLNTVHRQVVGIPPTAVPGAPEAAVFSEPFNVGRTGNVQVKVRAPVDNSWLYLDGALINDETGGLDEFDVEVSYYHGYDSDGSWTEGSQTSAAYIGSVPAGRYVLRLAPQWQPGLAVGQYEVTVRTGVPRFLYLFLATLAIFAWPAIASWRAFRFHVERWSDSDHPVFQSSED